MILVSSCRCLCPNHWTRGYVENEDVVGAAPSSYTWVINDYFAYKGAQFLVDSSDLFAHILQFFSLAME